MPSKNINSKTYYSKVTSIEDVINVKYENIYNERGYIIFGLSTAQDRLSKRYYM